jgi:cellulose synthase/poly-beta-1,6-N-acetylglucosamine synthase-like glycosyltransferase
VSAAAGWVAATVVWVLAVHAAVNAYLLRRPPADPPPVDTSVAVLLPVRDEAHRVGPCLAALKAQRGVPDLEVLVLDDGSTDGTADVVRDAGLRLLTGGPLPPGWLGKPHACQQLADATDAEILVFVDADVVPEAHAVAATVALLDGFDLVSPYPKIVGQPVVQQLLQWSWLTFLPLRAMERSRRPSLAAAGGQFLAVRADAYRRAGGHAAVRDKVIEDVELARAVKRAGGRIALADGSRLATCHMYASWRELVDGYAKSLWASPGAAVGAVVLLALYVAPLVTGAGLVAYLGGVAGRVVAARASGGRLLPALAHPVSILLFCGLVALSFRRRRHGRLAWKGRPVE